MSLSMVMSSKSLRGGSGSFIGTKIMSRLQSARIAMRGAKFPVGVRRSRQSPSGNCHILCAEVELRFYFPANRAASVVSRPASTTNL